MKAILILIDFSYGFIYWFQLLLRNDDRISEPKRCMFWITCIAALIGVYWIGEGKIW